MPAYITKRWLLFLVVAVFVSCKIPHLFYPYYWDESWPYAVAVKAMYNNGISLMPTAIDAELSRGHPLFFHFIAAGWMRIFGDSHVAMHSFALLISVLFLIAIYEGGLRLFNQRVASLAILLVATQVFFYVQSSFLLFEMLIAFLGFVSLYFYSTGRYLLTGICLSMLFYTKESGLIVGFVIGLDALVGLFSKHRSTKDKWLAIAAIGVPCILIAIFFLVQKHLRGWYVFPLYAGIIEHNWSVFWYKFRMGAIRNTVYDNYRFYYMLLPVVLAIVAAIKQKSLRIISILLPVCCIYYFVDDMRAGRLLPSVPFFIAFLLSSVYFLVCYTPPAFFKSIQQRRFIMLTGLFILSFFCYSPMNYYLYRYMMIAIVPLLFLVAVWIDMLTKKSYAMLYYPATAAVLVISFIAFKYNEGLGDVSLAAFKAMEVQQGITDYMEGTKDYDADICSGAFIEQQHLINKSSGFLHSDSTFKHAHWECTDRTRYVIFDNQEIDARYEEFKKDTSFTLAYRIERGVAWGEVYKRKTPVHN